MYIKVMLVTFVHYCVLLDCEFLIHVDFVSLFIIRVWGPIFSFEWIKKYSTDHGLGSKIVCMYTGHCRAASGAGTQGEVGRETSRTSPVMDQPPPSLSRCSTPSLLRHSSQSAVILPTASPKPGLPWSTTASCSYAPPRGWPSSRTIPWTPIAWGARLQHATTPATPSILPTEPTDISGTESLQYWYA